MAKVMLHSAELVFLQPIVYDKASINPLAPWRRAGITDFAICNVFNVPLDDSCPEYGNVTSNGGESQYFAIGTFEIAAIENMNAYTNKIMEIFTSDAFIDKFTQQMNEQINNYTLNGSERRIRRRQLLSQYNGFSAISVHIIEPLNYTTESPSASTAQSTPTASNTKLSAADENSFNFNLKIIFGAVVFSLLVIAVIISYIIYKRFRSKDTTKDAAAIAAKAQIELNSGIPVIQKKKEKNHDIEGFQEVVTQNPVAIAHNIVETHTSLSLAPNPVAGDNDVIKKKINAIHYDSQNTKVNNGNINIISGVYPKPMGHATNNDSHVINNMDSLDILQMKYAQNEANRNKNGRDQNLDFDDSSSSGNETESVPPPPPPPPVNPLPTKNDKYEDSLDQIQFQFLSDEINQIEDHSDLANVAVTKGGPTDISELK